MSVVGIRVGTNVAHGSDGCDVSRVQDEQKWAKAVGLVERRKSLEGKLTWSRRTRWLVPVLAETTRSTVVPYP